MKCTFYRYFQFFIDGNNVLHLAAKNDASNVSRVLFTESQVDPKLKNAKGKTFLHLVSFFGEENAVDQFNALLEAFPDYPINEQDLDGNIPLFIAYQQGQAALCVALAKAGSILAQSNNEGLNIFNLEAASQRFILKPYLILKMTSNLNSSIII